MLEQPLKFDTSDAGALSGEFTTIGGERYYAIRNVDRMDPFFITIVSNADHWLFVSSTGGLTAGRVSADNALFPYLPVDRIHESAPHTGSKTSIRVGAGDAAEAWEPFNREQHGGFAVSRNLYKSVLGNKLCFEEINHDLKLAFRCAWATSDEYGFVRQCTLHNLGDRPLAPQVLDGLQNVLPAGTPLATQTNASNLVDAYKWTELDEATGLAVYTLYSGISDRAEPCESLRANTIFCLGIERERVLLSSAQLDAFRAGTPLRPESHKRGIRGAYLVCATLDLAPGGSRNWQIVANVEQTQAQVVGLRSRLRESEALAETVATSVDRGSDQLARIMAAADGLQLAAEEHVTTHHYANVLFNVLRGGTFDAEYTVSTPDVAASVRHFNRPVYERHETFLAALPDTLARHEFLSAVEQRDDPQLERLCYEYLPIRFGRRHGDPSRPWNRFTIRLRDEYGKRLLSYEGNWRDIFQNWEALTFSYPDFVESVIAKFVNASTPDGYNPYRITKEGIEWEVEDPDDPWSYIGYWGDHQIIYLLKLLEISRQFHPARLAQLLRRPIFSYANVPYRIRPFEDLLANPKSTVDFDHALAERIARRVEETGADGKLVLDANGAIYTATLLEKLLVPLLAKLGNLVIDGGIWLNTQRPEWNDANNALVGNGLSMVTLYYLRRYLHFLQRLLATESGSVELSTEVSQWLSETAAALAAVRPLLGVGPIPPAQRFACLRELGMAADRYRSSVYAQEGFRGTVNRSIDDMQGMLEDALVAVDHSIGTNRRGDSLYHAYNLLRRDDAKAEVDPLYPMLEGQVAVLSSGAIDAEEACTLLESLFDSDMYRSDQQTFMLYPDRNLPGFLAKNRVPSAQVEALPVLRRMLARGDHRLIVHDVEGCYRFNADFRNAGDLAGRIDALAAEYGEDLESAREDLLRLYEEVFNHRAFTGRSGGMFGFEGLGCIYWHMVAKLLLAVQENFFSAREGGADASTRRRLGQLYYRVRAGLGFNKTPDEYGAFPTDPYSHTPGHAGARQPGMTGQVKEEVLTRFGELGIRVRDGAVRFDPGLLRACELSAQPTRFRYLDIHGEWEELPIPANALVFTWCQVPIIYRLEDSTDPRMTLTWREGKTETLPTLALSETMSSELFLRTGRIRQISISLSKDNLLVD